MTRRILIFTGTRAEYGLLRNVLRHLVKQDGIDAHLLVSGSHLSSVFGGTRDEIEKDGRRHWAWRGFSCQCVSEYGVGHGALW